MISSFSGPLGSSYNFGSKSAGGERDATGGSGGGGEGKAPTGLILDTSVCRCCLPSFLVCCGDKIPSVARHYGAIRGVLWFGL